MHEASCAGIAGFEAVPDVSTLPSAGRFELMLQVARAARQLDIELPLYVYVVTTDKGGDQQGMH
eukprot:5628355-Alexandrium_andersonii.AAC.1